MMRQYELVERVLAYDPKANEALINRAYVYAMKAHSHQKRASGDPYFSHPLEVAAILTDLRLDDATIATALLHDVIEDTASTKAEIDHLFGPEIGGLVDGLTKIKKLDLVSKKAEQAENFRKLLIAISTDIRVLLVKLADRLHNMRTLEHMKPDKRLVISEETLEIYAPLAGRMGMQTLREELEDLAFRWLKPEAYATISSRLERLRERNKGLVGDIGSALRARLAEAGIAAEVYGREKRAFSIWRKIETKRISLEQLSDIYAFRIIAKSVDDCYRALGLAHSSWQTVPGRFKDYISTPKQNGYQSIHTTIFGPRNQRVELQIRTADMHEIADYGVAAHALYKDKARGPGDDADVGPYAWLRRMAESILGGNAEEVLEHTKLELFHDQVFCFTPKGRIIALPHGATPIDFAYAVHTDIGNSATGVNINGRQQAMSTRLRNGDEVEILTGASQTPPTAWEGLAVTGRARAAIRKAGRDARRQQWSGLGQRLIATRFEKHQIAWSLDKIAKAAQRLGLKTSDDVLMAVGRGELAAADVARAVAPELVATAAPAKPSFRPRNRYDTAQSQDGWFNIAKAIGLKFRLTGSRDQPPSSEPAIPIRGIKGDLAVNFEEGGAVPGDRIVGVMMPGEGIRVFQIHSPRLRDFEHERWVDVTWDVDPERAGGPERFPARMLVTVVNEPGTLAQVAQVIGEADGNIDNLRMLKRGPDFTDMLIEVEVWDLEHLNTILAGLKAKPAVSSAERIFELTDAE
jgi:GTP pyrophosphokinase